MTYFNPIRIDIKKSQLFSGTVIQYRVEWGRELKGDIQRMPNLDPVLNP